MKTKFLKIFATILASATLAFGVAACEDNQTSSSSSTSTNTEQSSSESSSTAPEDSSGEQMHTHSYTAVVTAPTCTEQGYTTYTCSCEDSYVSDYVNALDHEEKTHQAKAPTCTEIGWNEYVTCERTGCDYSTYQELPATGNHTWDSGSITTEPTCTEKGVKTFTCTVCKSAAYTEDVNALTHDEKTHQAKAPTCTEIGWNEYVTCERTGCDYSTYQELPATGNHTWDSGNITTEPTCTTKGVKTFTCTVCTTATKTEDVKALTHDEQTHQAKAPTCTEIGWNEYVTCERTGCDYSTYEELPATGNHTWDSGSITTEPTCTEKGVKTFTCTVCTTATKTEDVKALTHDEKTHQAKAPTCTEIGWNEYVTCERNGCDYSTYKEISALTHEFINYVSDDNAKCGVNGTETATCNRDGCDEKDTREDEDTALTHDITTHEAKAATYTTIGWYEYETCDRQGCDYSTYQEIPALMYDINFTTTSLAYTINSDNTTCTITGVGEFTETEIYIPATLGGYTVTAIAEKAFENQSQITVLELPTTITTIGTRAFYGCSGLTEMTIPSSVTSIGTKIFYKAGVETVYYNSNYSSSENPFLNVSHLKTVIFNGTKVPTYILQDCALINKIVISNCVISIGEYAFKNCNSLTSVTIGDRVRSIGSCAFEGCSGLTSVYITDISAWYNISFTGFTSNPLYYANNLYLKGVLVTELIIPDTVISIGDYAFNGCSSLTSVTIGDRVKSIGDYAFYDCSSLTNVTIPEGVTSIGEYAFQECSSLTDVTIPEGVTSIGWGAFYYCSSLTSVTIGNGVKRINGVTFSNCRKLKNIIIPNSVTSIDGQAFYYCSNLTSITIPEGVRSIGSHAFWNCSLISVIIHDSVTSIGRDAFMNCGLVRIYYTGSAKDWQKISIDPYNSDLKGAKRYYYNGSEPELNEDDTAYDGDYWRYVDGIATPWVYTKEE